MILLELYVKFKQQKVKVITQKGKPTPKTVTLKELKEKNYDSYYVEIKGAVIDTSAKTLTQGDDVIRYLLYTF